MPASQGGVGTMLFSAAMTAGRLSGDAIVARLGPRRMLIVGGLLAIAAGFVVLLAVPLRPTAMAGFPIGFGASNLVATPAYTITGPSVKARHVAHLLSEYSGSPFDRRSDM